MTRAGGARWTAARISAALLAILVALAVAAPLIACGRPFALHVPAGSSPPGFGALPEGWSFPWFSGLFDRRLYESPIDRFFNALLLLAPVALLLRRHARRPWIAVALLAAAALLAVALAHPAPSRDYRGRIERLRAAGADVAAVFPPLPYSPEDPDLAAPLVPPGSRHWLGTDAIGRDVGSRLLHGTRVSLSIGLFAVAIYVAIGTLLGALAGWFGGWLDFAVSRLIEVIACFPYLLLLLTLMAFVAERSVAWVIAVIGLTGWPTIARLVRAEFLRQRELDYALAARALGLSGVRIALRHLLPNSLAPVLVSAAFGVGAAILLESGLAFLHLGDPVAPSWGLVLRDGRDTGALHLILGPGLLIFMTVTAMNVVADSLRERMDPRRTPARRTPE